MSKITASSKNSNTLPANESKREKHFLWFVLTAALLGGGREESWKDVRTCPQLSSLSTILFPPCLFPPSSFFLLPFSPSFLSFLYLSPSLPLPFSSSLSPFVSPATIFFLSSQMYIQHYKWRQESRRQHQRWVTMTTTDPLSHLPSAVCPPGLVTFPGVIG